MMQSGNVKLLYEAKDFPVFQNHMYDTVEEAIACPRGDIQLVQNLDSGLIYNDAFNPDLMNYDSDYQNEQGLSEIFRKHLKEMAVVIEKAIGKTSLVEVGCGKGFFLEMLLEWGFDITGFDPVYEGDNARIERQSFKPGSGIKAQGIILRHVLEHIQDPFSFLMSIKEANNGVGLIYIEVPCFDWICEHKAWFDVFYEHVNYFRLSDFSRMFDNIIDSGRVFGGQYLYIVADFASMKKPVSTKCDVVEFPSNFLASLAEGTESRSTAAWGGASKGVIFSLLKSRIGQPVDLMIDINPAKQKRYVPATGLMVMSPDEGLSRLPNGSTIYVMNSNYLKEIKEMSNYSYNYVSVDHG